MAPTRTHRDRPRPSDAHNQVPMGRLTKNQVHVHILYASSERASADVPRQSLESANQSLVYAALPNETSGSPRGSTILPGHVSPRSRRRSPALQPGVGAAFPSAEVRDQPSVSSEPRALTSRGHCTVRRWAEKEPAACRIALPSWSKMLIITFIVGIQENESFVVHPFRGTRRDSTYRGDNIKRRKKSRNTSWTIHVFLSLETRSC